MEQPQISRQSSREGLASKLLPKSISDKRLQRKRRKEGQLDGRLTASSSMSSLTNGASHVVDEDDNRSLDGRSFGSFESGPEPEPTASSTHQNSSSRSQSRSPSRPAKISPHPSLIGYLTTSSPIVQAEHIDSSDVHSPSRTEPVRTPVDTPIIIEPTTKSATASPTKRSKASRNLDYNKPSPLLPTKSDIATPAIVNTPPTPTEGPFEDTPAHKRSTSTNPASSHADGIGSAQTWSPHKRSTSASATIGPSKLSNVSSLPLTPPAEDIASSTGNGSGTGFFSSMFSAAQSAATNLSSNIQNTGLSIGNNKARPAPEKQQPDAEPSREMPQSAAMPQTTTEQKESAVRTIGTGDLSLSALGLDEPSTPIGSPPTSKLADTADTRLRSESAPADAPLSSEDTLPDESPSRPRSFSETQDGEGTASSVDIDDKNISRTASLRNANQAHRKRGSSVTTGGTNVTLGTPLSTATTNTVVPANGNFSSPKLTGFAIASKKRNRDFHTIFKSVPDDDYLIEDYSCALQREILAHGRLYVSEGHLCFSSNILGWTTTLVMSFDEIVSVEKRSTALLFKNGLMISTLHAKHVFASFTSRDATYDLIVNIWKLGHPTLTSTLNGVRLEGTGGDKTEKLDSTEVTVVDAEAQEESDIESSSEEDGEEFYDEEEHEEIPVAVSVEPAVDGEAEKPVARKASAMTTATTTGPAAQGTSVPPASNAPSDFPGPATHAPTECGDTSSHFEKITGDDVIAAPLGRVYSLLFGPASTTWLVKFLVDNQKSAELQFEDKKGLSLDNKSRTYTFIKPLGGSIGPKQTRCTISETLENLDFEKAINLTSSTSTPDVPSGNVFAVKTHYCLSWAENNATRVQVNCTIEWTGKSWLKGPIEKGANDGQAQYCKELFAALRSTLTSRSRAGTGTNGAGKPKKKGKKGKTNQSSLESTEKGNAPPDAAKQSWGMLEPIRPLLEPVTDIVKPLLTGNVMYGLLVGLLVASWFGFGLSPGRSAASYGNQPGFYGPDRLAAYEEMWRREDSELWDWLEERVGLERLNEVGPGPRKRAAHPRTFETKMREDRLNTKEVEAAMRVTEEKLRVLQEAVERASRSPVKRSEAQST